MSDRRAVLEWPTAQRAELTRSGWSVDPPDPMLVELLNTKHSLGGRPGPARDCYSSGLACFRSPARRVGHGRRSAYCRSA